MDENDRPQFTIEELTGIIPHVFLPRRLPSAQQEKLIDIEQDILRILKWTTGELNGALFPNAFPKTCKLFSNWVIIQPKLSSSFLSHEVANVIQSMEAEDNLAFYIRRQNAGLLISSPKNDSPEVSSLTDNVILSSFQASAHSTDVMSSPGDITMYVPEISVIVPRSPLLNSTDFSEQLGYLTRDPIEMALPKSFKAGHHFNEVRDTADPMFIIDWITSVLCSEKSQVNESFPRIHKKVRDDVSLKDTLLPFRRSGLWMTAKIALQISLIRELGHELGTVLYKATLIKMMHFILMQLPNHMEENWDLKMQILAKLARRLEKLKSKCTDLQTNHQTFSEGITSLANFITSDIQRIRNGIDRQWANVAEKSQPQQLITLSTEEIQRDIIHKMEELQSHIRQRKETMKKINSESNTPILPPTCPQRIKSPAFPNFTYSSSGYDQDFELFDTEVWIRIHLDSYCSGQFAKQIWNLITQYSKKASIHYKDDPLASSRMVLTVLKCLQVLDRIALKNHPLLAEHKSGVELKAMEAVLIPTKADMELLREMQNYFLDRDANSKYGSLIDEKSPSANSFSVRFAKQSEVMTDLRTSILETAELEIEAKKQEVLTARQECSDIEKRIWSVSHENIWNSYQQKHIHSEYNCTKCSLEREYKAKLHSVRPYGRPLPDGDDDQFAVVFELIIPCEIACLRDALRIFRVDVCSYQCFGESKIHKQWKSHEKVCHHSNHEGEIVLLGTTKRSTLETHYAQSMQLLVTGDENNFILNNGMDCVFNAEEILSGMKSLYPRCTFQIEKTNTTYSNLQWALSGILHTPNEVLAKQYSCHQDLRLSEFVQFGHLRAGNRLQYRNIIMSLVNGKLSLKAEPVFQLLCQAQWQVGSPSSERSFLQDSHFDFSETPFARKSLKILNELVDANSKNWSDAYTLMNLVVICTRLLELVADANVRIEAARLLQKCRKISDEWVGTISDLISKAYEATVEEKANLKSKLVDAALCSVLTFHVSNEYIPLVISSSEDLVIWFNAVSTLYDEIHWNTTGLRPTLSPMRLSLLRLSINIGISLQNNITNLINSTKYKEGLNSFTSNRWKAAESFGNWHCCTRISTEQVFECRKAMSNDGLCHVVHLDIVLGKFLVDGCPVGTLPEELVKLPAYQRVFSTADFRVQPNKNRIFSTTSEYHGCMYNFSYQNANLIVIEVMKKKQQQVSGEYSRKLELINHNLFDKILPNNLVNNCSHWWNEKDNTIMFRSKSFNDPNFAGSETHILCLKTMTLREIIVGRNMISLGSPSFSKIVNKLKWIEPCQFIHVWQSDKGSVDIELVILGLKFTLEDGLLMSHEFPGMNLNQEQNIGTLVGLQNKLVLVGKRISELFKPAQRVIIPHANLKLSPSDYYHQSISVNLEDLKTPRFFVYEVDERFQTLKAGRNHSAWFYLAALHVATSSPLPDPFTSITGTEMAFQILQSARCWSSEPYDIASLNSLRIIDTFSPQRVYNPPKLECMQTVLWPSNLPSTSAHEGLTEIVLKLYRDSKRLGVLFSSSVNHNEIDQPIDDKDIEEKIFNASCRRLRIRHYWRQLPFGNELSSISKQFDPEFLITQPSTRLYERVSLLENRTQKLKDIRTISDLCLNWNFYLEDSMINSIRRLLVTSENLEGWTKKEGVHGISITSSNIQNWLGYEFRSEWINLYSFALNLNKHQNWKSKWALIMSTLVFKGVPLEQILILQAIAVNSEYFPEAPELPMYSCPNTTFNRREIIKILDNEAEGFSEYNSSGARKYSTATECQTARNQHQVEVESQIEIHASAVTLQWNTEPMARYQRTLGASKIDIGKAVIAINNKLQQWYQNHLLNQFVEEVESNLKLRLECSSHKPHTIDFITQNVDRSVMPQFRIDFEHILTRQISTATTDSNTINSLVHVSSQMLDKILSLGSCKKDKTFYDQKLRELIVESTAIWNLITTLMTPSESKALVAAGLYPRLTPITLLPVLMQRLDSEKWVIVQNLIGRVGLIWTMEQRLIRCITYLTAGPLMEVALQKELETKGHENWSPMEQPGWLILELEMNMMIRPIQLKVAQEMMSPEIKKNSVMQLNMGEGKTALIVPMLAIALANGKQLCRVTVLRSIYETNLNALRHTLGGLLNQRIYTVPCRRDLEMDVNTTQLMLSTYKECMAKRGIVVTLPEYRLSFQLKGYEMARNGKTEFAELLINIQSWLNTNSRDILDESDEILSVKYQLVYTVGNQLHVGGGEMRWIIAQKLLKLLVKRMKDLFDKYGESFVEYDFEKARSGNPEIFTPCRLLRKDCYEYLINDLAEDFLDGKLLRFLPLKIRERKIIKSFLTNNDITEEDHKAALQIFEDKGNAKSQEIILILAGYLRYGVLQAALSKRWRVNYGVNPKGHRKMAVPFKAKDVASERTEFGHPDMAIVLTQISYYYSGLSDDQLQDCFDILKNRCLDPTNEYDSWIQTIPADKIHPSVKSYGGINISDYEQRTKHLFPMLRNAMCVIDFWLSNIVFPKESKQFPGKMTTNAWDLCSENQKLLTTGFSGTNDSSNLYPIMISQNDLEELQNTNKQLEATLLKEENNNYYNFQYGVKCPEILKNLQTSNIRVLLDCGALMLELNNSEVAKAWLEINQDIQAVVYFNKKNFLTVKSRQGKDVQFELSPFRDRLDVCAVYLDDEHTRGTDLKFPRGSKACVTIGSGLTRDKMVQACMRMRMLGKGHTVSFWASHEAHNKIRDFTHCGETCTSKDVLEWVRENSRQFQNEGLVYWTASGVNYCRKMGAERLFEYQSQNGGGPKSDILKQLGERCSEPECIELIKMYGQFRKEDLFVNIIPSWFSHAKRVLTKSFTLEGGNRKILYLPPEVVELFSEVEKEVTVRCQKFIPSVKNFTQLLDEEQEKELEQEKEDQEEVNRPHEAIPQKHQFERRSFLQALSAGDVTKLGGTRTLPFGFMNTALWKFVQSSNWGNQIYVTNDFIKTIELKHTEDNVDCFLRPPTWVISMKSKAECKTVLLLISPFEANELIPEFRRDINRNINSTLHIYTPRLLPEQKILINSADLCLPPRTDVHVDDDLLAPLSLFSGTLYFANEKEQTSVGNFLGIIPRPRTKEEDDAFEKGEIDQNGFVRPEHRHSIGPFLRKDGFDQNPDVLVREIVRTRNQGFIPSNAHIGKLVLDGMKNEFNTVVFNEDDTDLMFQVLQKK